jgi:hypothetical protein
MRNKYLSEYCRMNEIWAELFDMSWKMLTNKYYDCADYIIKQDILGYMCITFNEHEI